MDQTLTLEQLAGDADALRGMLGVSQIDILAHSVGGFVALTYALRYPQHLGRLILMNTAPAWDYGETIAARALAKGATANDLGLLDLSKCHEDSDLAMVWRQLAPLYFAKFNEVIAKQMTDRLRGPPQKSSARMTSRRVWGTSLRRRSSLPVAKTSSCQPSNPSASIGQFHART